MSITQYVTFPATIPASNIDYLHQVVDATTGLVLYTFEHGEYQLDLPLSRPSQSIAIPGSDAPYDPFGAGGFPLDKRTATLKFLKRYRTSETHSANRIALHRALADGRQVQLVMLDSGGATWIATAKQTSVPTKITKETIFSMDIEVVFELNPPVFRQLYPTGWFYWDAPGVYWDDQSHAVDHVTINTPGSYSVAPTGVVFTGGGLGSGATATATAGTGTVTGTTLTAGGSGYTGQPTVAFSGGGGSGATANAQMANGAVIGLYITNAGTGYSSAPTIAFSGGGGSGAAATALISGVTALAVGAAGSNYLQPVATITGGGGSGATAAVLLTGTGPFGVAGFVITNPGSGYTSNPTVTITDGAQATGTVVTAGAGPFTVTGVTITNPGTGYASAPTVAFTGGTGTAATATAVLGAVSDGFTWDSNSLPTLALTASSQTITVNNIGDAVDRYGKLTITGPWVPFDLQVFDANGTLRTWITWTAALNAGDVLTFNNQTGEVLLNGQPAFDGRFAYRGNDYFAFWPGISTVLVLGYATTFTGANAAGTLAVDYRSARY